MNTLTETIPKYLIYEEHLGQPIYYKGYREFLNNPEKISKSDVMGTSALQSIIISRIMIYLAQHIDHQQYECLTNAVGLHFNKGENRACDIVIFEKSALKNYTMSENYFTIPPKIVIEVDIKADLENTSNANYWQTKTQQLLDFGVEKVIWISTNPRKVTLATHQPPWLTYDWTENIELVNGVYINLNELTN
jgi:Uma2 family endonuclease